jgi:hypothetical protein
VDPSNCLMETLVLRENQEGVRIRRSPGDYAKHLPWDLERVFLQTLQRCARKQRPMREWRCATKPGPVRAQQRTWRSQLMREQLCARKWWPMREQRCTRVR